MRTDIHKNAKSLKKYMDLKLAKSNMAMNTLQAECDTAHKEVANAMRSNQLEMQSMRGDFVNMSGSLDVSMMSMSPPRRNNRAAADEPMNKISVPFEIDGEDFVLELDNIRSIEVIDLNAIPDESEEPVKPDNILDMINQAPVVHNKPKKMTEEDRDFLKHVFEELKYAEPQGPDYVRPRNKDAPVNNFDRQFPELVATQGEEQPSEAVDGLDALAKAIENAKKERYIKYLQEDQEAEIRANDNKRKALDCMTKLIDHKINTIKMRADDVLERHREFTNQMTEFEREQDENVDKIFR